MHKVWRFPFALLLYRSSAVKQHYISGVIITTNPMNSFSFKWLSKPTLPDSSMTNTTLAGISQSGSKKIQKSWRMWYEFMRKQWEYTHKQTCKFWPSLSLSILHLEFPAILPAEQTNSLLATSLFFDFQHRMAYNTAKNT